MRDFINVEGAERAARRIESAAAEAAEDTRAADRMEDALRQLTALVGSGYGNVAERLLEALEKQQAPNTESDLARVTAEREEMKQERDTAEMFAESALDNGDVLKAEVDALRARVAELVAALRTLLEFATPDTELLAALEGLFATDSIRQTTSSASSAAVVAARKILARKQGGNTDE